MANIVADQARCHRPAVLRIAQQLIRRQLPALRLSLGDPQRAMPVRLAGFAAGSRSCSAVCHMKGFQFSAQPHELVYLDRHSPPMKRRQLDAELRRFLALA
jgi:hypothetical protein